MTRLSLALLGIFTLLASAAGAKDYQKLVNLSCASNACIGLSPKVPQGKTLKVTSLSCSLLSSTPNVTALGIVSIHNSNNLIQYLRLEPAAGVYATNGIQEMAITLRSGKQLRLTLVLASGQVASLATCGLRGKIN